MQPGNDPSSKTRGKFAPILLSFFAVGLGFYITQLVIVARKPCSHPEIRHLSEQKDVAARYDETADGFDSEVGSSEALMGINSIRKRLSKQCKGHVLEVSCGTGRNLGYYPLHPGSEIDSITFLDLSPQMIAVCKKKWLALYPSTSTQKFKQNLAIRFSTSSALEPMPPAPTTERSTEQSKDLKGSEASRGKYTTIIQTMGLCSVPDPHLLLVNLATHLDTSDPSARILLLEHGRSDYAWLNNILDNAAQKHAEIHGCWFNRDIGGMVEAAAAESGLEIVSEKRKHLGTTWVFELKPSEKTVAAAKARGGPQAVGSVLVEDAKPEAGWRGWLGLK
jgi:methyltransferase OMS1